MSKALEITSRIVSYFAGRIPTWRRARPLQRQDPTLINASTLDVDFVHAILTQADAGDARQLMGLYDTIIYGDSHLQGELAKRKLAVLGDPWNVSATDLKNPDDVAAAAIVTDQLRKLGSFFDANSALLDGCLFPVVVIERIYRVSSKPGLRYDLADLVPVPMAMLYFDPLGPLRVFDVDPATGVILSTHQMLDPLRYIVHRGHLLGDRDHRGGPMRSLVFWWLFSAFDRDWWARFLDRYGSPFLVGKYDQQDDDSRLVLERAFRLATRLGGIVISRETEVEIQQAMSRDVGEAFQLFHDICQKEKSKLIVGQTTSASADAAGGLGSGVGTAQAAVRDDIRQFDRLRLADTLKHQVAQPFLELNGIHGDVTISFGAEAPEDTEKTSRALANLANAGIEVADESLETLGERMGLRLRRKAAPVPAPGGAASALTQTQSPAAIPDRPLGGLSGNDLATLAAAVSVNPRLLLADAANARVAHAGAADLARAFGGDLAPLQRILALSSSAADFEARLRDAFPDWEPRRTVPILKAGLAAYAANALPG